ncbi:lytic transglycosylase domain-containing protein [Pararhizobium antarcticum]|uniref:Lytic transglycosylase n=1 Tax=Pararhizobium antarcticum TaxID=1798805 RepID=A0A657LPR8_9HYPH|nr:lytic transglycosylase domain-containing protein [Pararhizobium antarcticum]OJF94439.1 lytic transglycosylase [Pararhizobium antarcticum]OJF97702.1 lytic transglycosylase [Rhizobium sp. 58]
MRQKRSLNVPLLLGLTALVLPVLAAWALEPAKSRAKPDLRVAQSQSVAPSQTTPTSNRVASAEVTGSIPSATAPMAGPVTTRLRAGLDALSNRQAPLAIEIRNSMAADTLDRHILTWAIAVSGQKGIPSREIAGAQTELKGWPGLGALRGHSERALARENPSATTTLSVFGASQPETTEGTILLAHALLATGRSGEATTLIANLWSKETLDTAREDKILSDFSALLSATEHKRRMDMLLYRGRGAQAERFSGLGKAQSLYRAWTAVAKGAKNAGALIAAVDPSWKNDPAFLFIRIENLRKQDRYEDAARLLATLPSDRAALIDTGEWWVEQRVVSRGLADRGDYRTAYRIVANHVATDAADIVDAEFHAGWYALRGLKDPKTAAAHFQRILKASNRPISVSRAWYWLGRAAEGGGPGKSADFFTKAAAFSGTYYGQLAAARLGQTALNVAYPSPSASDRTNFDNREAVRAIARLEAAGHGWRADSLYRALAEDLTSPGELAILASRAEKSRGHQLSLQIGKLAFGRGIDVAALAFPVGVIPASADIAGAGKALAYAIARQESAFNPAAISPANARGLLQILPGTAKGVAGRHGLAYSQERLTTDSAYNATLGAHYLGEQIDTFGGSYILTFIAYNAGPRRVPDWIGRYGDPRGKSIDEVVDWIERIPFVETRNYVQRVMENYQVYKSRLGQKTDIVHDLRLGR